MAERIIYRTSDRREFDNENDARKHQDLIDRLSQEFPSNLENAKKGNSAAQFNVGQCYFYGWGVGKDQEKAFFWYSKADVNGSKNAKDQIHLYELAGTGGKTKKRFADSGDLYEGYYYEGKFCGVGQNDLRKWRCL